MIGHFAIPLCLALPLVACLLASAQEGRKAAPQRGWTRFVLPGAKQGQGARDLVAIGDEVFAWVHGGLFFHVKAGKGTHVPAPTQQVLAVVWGTRTDEVYAAGDEGVVLRFDGKTLQQVGEPLKTLNRIPGFSGNFTPRPTPVRLRYLWASSGTDIYAAGEYACLLHYDGKAWQEVDIGARQVVVPTQGRLGRRVVTPRVGPIWGTSASDVWVRKEVVRLREMEGVRGPSYDVDHVVMHFDGQKWRQTDVKLPVESVSNVGRSPVEPELLAVSPKAIWLRFDGGLWRWDGAKNDWRKEAPLGGGQHWLTWTVSSSGSALALSRQFHRLTPAGWRARPELGDGYLRGAAIRKMVLTADGSAAAITYRDDDLHVWKE